ncbi:MAG: coxB [Actinomycetia bacterium]|nr:coxB [Actinomycetes bacterium]
MIRRAATWTLVVVGTTLVLSACSSPSMLDPKGTEARSVARIWWLMFGLAAGVYLVVGGFILVAVMRGRRTSDGRSSRISDHAFVWLGGIVVPIVILFVLGVVTVNTTAALRRPDADPLRIQVEGKRWWWAVSYTGTGITSAGEIHLPTGRPIEITLTSDNVIHSFWVPQLAGKLDVIPGQRNVLRFKITHPGDYRGECAEFCGIQHANMNFRVVAESPGLYERWVSQHRNAPIEPASDVAASGEHVFQSQSCAGCHAVRGTQAHGTLGPDLTDIGARPLLGGGVMTNTPANLARWINDAPKYKPGVLMPAIHLSTSQTKSIVAYLESLK